MSRLGGVLAIVSLLSTGCGAAETPRPAAPPPAAPAPSSFVVAYREAADVFEILDNVSNWLPDKCDTEYREDWQRRFGIGPEDERQFASYKEIRKRYYALPPDDPAESGVFARRKPADRVAEAFYGASTIAEALSALGAFMKPDDVEALRSFYASHRPRYEALLAESRAHVELARNLQSRLDTAETAAYAREMARFYGVSEVPQMTVLYVWWPPVEAVTANNRGRYLILKYNPAKHRDSALRDVDIPIHELVHWISAHQPAAQKQALSRVFVSGCDVAGKLPGPRALEEPLAVAHQKLFLGTVAPPRLEFGSSWYGDPWVSTLAKLLYHPVADAHVAGRTLDEKLMKQAAKACAHLGAVAKMLR